MTPGVRAQFAGYLEELLGAEWRVQVYDHGGTSGVGVSCFIDTRTLALARRSPGTFLESFTPDVRHLAYAVKNRKAYRPTGPYASRVMLRRKAGL